MTTDGAAQDHFACPNSGDMKPEPHEWRQHVQGVMIEGKGVLIVRSGPHIQSGANFTISCVVLGMKKVFDDCDAKGVRRPSEFTLHVDGGETTYLLFTFFEFLVSQRIFQQITVMRLMVGHGHGHLDQKFGDIARLIDGKTIASPGEFFNHIKHAIKGVECLDIFVALDFEKWLHGCYATSGQTGQVTNWKILHDAQLHWRFCACNPSTERPLGVKVEYCEYLCSPPRYTRVAIINGDLRTSDSKATSAKAAVSNLLLKASDFTGGGVQALQSGTKTKFSELAKTALMDLKFHALEGNFLMKLPTQPIVPEAFSPVKDKAHAFRKTFQHMQGFKFAHFPDVKRDWEDLNAMMPIPKDTKQGFQEGEELAYIQNHPEAIAYALDILRNPSQITSPQALDKEYIPFKEQVVRQEKDQPAMQVFNNLPTVHVRGVYDARRPQMLRDALRHYDQKAIESLEKLFGDGSGNNIRRQKRRGGGGNTPKTKRKAQARRGRGPAAAGEEEEEEEEEEEDEDEEEEEEEEEEEGKEGKEQEKDQEQEQAGADNKRAGDDDSEYDTEGSGETAAGSGSTGYSLKWCLSFLKKEKNDQLQLFDPQAKYSNFPKKLVGLGVLWRMGHAKTDSWDYVKVEPATGALAPPGSYYLKSILVKPMSWHPHPFTGSGQSYVLPLENHGNTFYLLQEPSSTSSSSQAMTFVKQVGRIDNWQAACAHKKSK